MRRCSSKISSPLATLALFFFLLLVCSSLHGAAAARLLQPAVPLPVTALAHHEENGAKAAAASGSEGLVLRSAAVVSGDELSVSSEVSEAETEEEGAVMCEDGNDECLQRRLLRDAHLDYIYTQHKGKP